MQQKLDEWQVDEAMALYLSDDHLTYTDLGKLCNVSRNYFGKLWHNILPEGFAKTRANKLLENAQGYLDDGYLQVRHNGKLKPKHEAVVLDYTGWERIPEGYVVHHINQNPLDNRLENLAVIERGKHSALHHKIRRDALEYAKRYGYSESVTDVVEHGGILFSEVE